MALFGSLATLRAQASPADLFASTFEYLDDLFRDGSTAAVRLKGIAIGETQRIELGRGMFALEQVYRSKPRSEGFYESHRKYIDVQVIFEGEEWMEVIDLDRPVVKHRYDPQRDLVVYEDITGSLLRLQTGQAAIFYPSDVHMPGLAGSSAAQVIRKTVIKVPADGS